MKPKIKAVIFDWNGVIVDTLGMDHSIFLNVIDAINIKAPRTLSFYKSMFDNNIAASLRDIGFDDFHMKEVSARMFKETYAKNINSIKTFPNVKKTISTLKKKYKIGIVTSNFADPLSGFLKNSKMEGLFDYTLTFDDHHRKEEKIGRFLARFKLSKDEAVYVGDTVGDINMSKELGIKVIAASWGYHNASQLKKCNPDFMAEKPEDIIKILCSVEN